jgi:hypothetical protein
MSSLLFVVLIQAWHPGRPMPTPGAGFACASLDGRVYAIGGWSGAHGQNQPRRAVEAYDVAGDSWITGFLPIPLTRSFSGCAVLDGLIYVMGGFDGRVETPRVDRFDPAANHWDTVAPLPWPRQALGACEYGGKIYAVGGYAATPRGHYSRSVACYTPDPGPGSWAVVDSLNQPRASMGVAVADNRIYAVGGRFFNSLQTGEWYAPDLWTMIPSMMHVPRSGLGAASYQDDVFAVGGESQDELIDSVEVLNTASGIWRDDEPLRQPRAFLGVAVVGTSLIAMGGANPQGNTVADVEIHMVPFQGIAEEPPEPGLSTPSLTLLTHDRVHLTTRPDCRIELLDKTGLLLFSGQGALDQEAPQGIYFARIQTDRTHWTVGKIILVK